MFSFAVTLLRKWIGHRSGITGVIPYGINSQKSGGNQDQKQADFQLMLEYGHVIHLSIDHRVVAKVCLGGHDFPDGRRHEPD